MQSISDALAGLLCSVASLFIAPTVLVFMLKVFVPPLGEPLWRGYCQLLAWLIMLPFRLVQRLLRSATGRRTR